MSREEDAARLEEIVCEMKELMREARDIVRKYPGTEDRFKGYPYAHIVGALDNDHEFLGGSMFTLIDCIEEIKGGGDDE